jgi:glutathione S-transferase
MRKEAMRFQTEFNGSKLHLSQRSPFARRVRIAFEENEVQCQEIVRDVWSFNPDLAEINPIHRVPTLELPSGQVLTESSLILEFFYRVGERKLGFRTEEEWIRGLQWAGLSIGLIEKTIERFLETLRPEAERDPEFMNDLPRVSEQVLKRLDRELGDQTYLIGERLTQGDVDVGTALTYLRFRFDREILKSYPRIERYLDRLESRPSFQRTFPS